MKTERTIFEVVAVAAVLVVGACGKKPAPEMPAPRPNGSVQQTRSNADDGPAVTADAGAATRSTIESRRVAIENRIQFGYDRSDLTPEAQSILRAKVEVLRSEPVIRIRIEGNADERGSVEYNLALGLRRAHAARDFLIGFGLDPSRFEVTSNGEDRPLDRGTTEAAYARNRRDDFLIVGGSISGR